MQGYIYAALVILVIILIWWFYQKSSEGMTRIYNGMGAGDDAGLGPSGLVGTIGGAISPDLTYTYFDGVEQVSCDQCPNGTVCPTCPNHGGDGRRISNGPNTIFKREGFNPKPLIGPPRMDSTGGYYDLITYSADDEFGSQNLFPTIPQSHIPQQMINSCDTNLSQIQPDIDFSNDVNVQSYELAFGSDYEKLIDVDALNATPFPVTPEALDAEWLSQQGRDKIGQTTRDMCRKCRPFVNEGEHFSVIPEETFGVRNLRVGKTSCALPADNHTLNLLYVDTMGLETHCGTSGDISYSEGLNGYSYKIPSDGIQGI